MVDEAWQKPHVQRVLDYHNEKYSTDIAIIGQCCEIHHELKGGRDWDWSAINRKNGVEIAIEVKRLTNRRLEDKFPVLNQICQELSEELRGSLKGIFWLSTLISEEQQFNLKGTCKQQFKENLKELLLREAQGLDIGIEKDLAAEIRARLPEILPQDCYFTLQKLDNEGSYLEPNVIVSWGGPSEELKGEDLVEFRKLVRDGNHQLSIAKAKGISDTFLILLEIRFSGAEVDVIQKTVSQFDPSDFQSIEYCYFHSGQSMSSTGGSHHIALSDRFTQVT